MSQKGIDRRHKLRKRKIPGQKLRNIIANIFYK